MNHHNPLVENLESRRLLASAVVSVVATFTDASESNRTTTGRGEYVFKRPTGDTTLPLTIKYAINGDSTATNGIDFETLNGRITIPAGKRAVAMNLFPINDSFDEANRESVIVSIKNQAQYTVGHRSAIVTIRDNDPPISTQGWWDTSYHYRAPLNVSVGAFARTDATVERAINFTSLISQAGGSGGLIENSIRVVETNAAGNQVLDATVPFQFDRAAGFNASTNAAGTIVFVAQGNTAANATRYYHVYFDTVGSFPLANVPALVQTFENESDQGQDAIRIATPAATYWMQTENGGFSSIEDSAGNDWLSFDPTPGTEAGGEYRGTPNAVFPGGGFHAGFDNATTQVIKAGPLKTTIEVTSTVNRGAGNRTYVMRYEFYATHVRSTVVSAQDKYWFLYEGTPGGSIDGNDTVVRSTGLVTSINQSWSDTLGDANDEEWLYFRDSGVNKYMFFAHDTPDNLTDSYRRMDAGTGSMTVFGFGRDDGAGDPSLMSAANNSFTFGIGDGGGTFSTAAGAIRAAYRPINSTIGTPQRLP